MWSMIVTVGLFVLGLIFSLAKISSKAEKITESHNGELLARKTRREIEQDEVDKKGTEV